MNNQETPKPKDIPHFYESLEQLRKASSDNYHHRQTYEWKMCITIWTPLVAFIGISLTHPEAWMPGLTLVIACLFLAVIHLAWQLNLKASNDKDAEKILECEQKMRVHLGLPKSEAPTGFLVFKGWPHYIYLLITIGLIVLAIYVNDLKRNQLVMLPNELNEWIEKNPEIGFKKKNEYVVEILRKHIGLEEKKKKIIDDNINKTPKK